MHLNNMDTTRAPRLTLCAALVIVASMCIVARQWADYDLFWHLANGRLMYESGIFPSPDRFSWSATGERYIAYSAQIDRVFYFLWDVGGAPALGVASGILFGLLVLPFALLVSRFRVNWRVETIVLLAIIAPVLPFRGARPHAVSFVLYGILIYLLERPFTFRKACVAAVALGLWLHVHGTYLIGFGIMGIAVCVWLVAHDWRSAQAGILALVVGGAASLLSPYGIELWILPWRTVLQPGLVTVNQDWVGMRPFSPASIGMGLLLLVAVAIGIWRRDSARANVGLGLLLPTIQIARFTPFIAPLFSYLILEQLVGRLRHLTAPTRIRHSRLHARLNDRRVAWMILFVGLLPAWLLAPSTIEGASIYPLPTQSIDRLMACGKSSPVWVDYNWAGYLLWRGGGQFTVGIDGRAETLYSPEVLNDYLSVSQARDGWEAIIERSPTQYVLIPRGLAADISTKPGWIRVYQDNLAILAMREGGMWRQDSSECPPI